MTNEQLVALMGANEIDKLIDALKTKKSDADIDKLKKEFAVEGHAVMDKALRPNKQVETNDGQRTENVNRIAVSLQELICERAVSFLFGSPVKIQCDPVDDKQTLILKALNQVLKDNKIDSFNAEVALDLFRSCEVAECWYVSPTDDTYERYGFETKQKLKCMMFSPWNGDTLYPLFNDTGDLIAFSREYIVVEEGKDVTHFETYTADYIQAWKKSGLGWEIIKRVPNVIKKIPIVYAHQKEAEWSNVQNIIERLEKNLSNNADTVDYHGSPTLFATGNVETFAKKGEQGKLITSTDSTATLKYVSPDHGEDMVKNEYDILESLIYALTQTPNISFEAMQGLGDISGVAFDRLFVDAKLKVKKKRRIFDAYLERRTNLILSFLSYIKTDLAKPCKVINIDAVVQPFTFEDEKEQVDTLTTGVAGKVVSKKTAIKRLGMVDDVEAELKQINDEEAAANTLNVAPPAI